MSDFALHQHPVNIEDEMKRSYMDYAMSVIIGRALPDARDGLKPAHRRVLYGMKTMGLSATRGYRKCAKIRPYCRRRFRTCSSTAHPALPLAWRPAFRPTICAR